MINFTLWLTVCFGGKFRQKRTIALGTGSGSDAGFRGDNFTMKSCQPRLFNEDKMAQQTDYLKTFQTISSNDMKIQFTPQPLFFETTTEWAQALQDIYAGADAKERLDKLVESLTEQLKDAGIYQE